MTYQNNQTAKGDQSELIRSYEPMVRSLVYQYTRGMKRPTSYYEDLLQEGRIAVFKAIGSFDPGRGADFSTHAYWQIKSALYKFLGKNVAYPGRAVAKYKRASSLSGFGSEMIEDRSSSLSGQAMYDSPTIEDMLAFVPDNRRDIVRLRFVDGLLIREISVRLKKSTAWVKKVIKEEVKRIGRKLRIDTSNDCITDYI